MYKLKWNNTMKQHINQALLALVVSIECSPNICIMGLLDVLYEGLLEASDKEDERINCLIEDNKLFDEEFFDEETIREFYEDIIINPELFQTMCKEASNTKHGRLHFSDTHIYDVYLWLMHAHRKVH